MGNNEAFVPFACSPRKCVDIIAPSPWEKAGMRLGMCEISYGVCAQKVGNSPLYRPMCVAQRGDDIRPAVGVCRISGVIGAKQTIF